MRQSLTPGQQDLSIAATESLGNYRLARRRPGRPARPRLQCQFAGGDQPAASEPSRPKIVEALGSNRARIARTQQEIELRVGLGRVGRELFPALIIAVALVLAAEQLLANRFYGAGPAAARL